MTAWLSAGLSFAATVSVVIACALLLTCALRQRISARSLYLAWLVVLLCALIPFRLNTARPAVTLSTPVVLQAADTPVFSQQSVQDTGTPAMQTLFTQTQDNLIVNHSDADDQPDAAIRTEQTADNAASYTAPQLQWGTVIVTLYAIGALSLLGVHCIRHMRYMRLLRRWRQPVADRRVLALYDEVRQDMGIRRSIPLFICRAAGSPMIVGIVHPCILLPDDRLSLSELQLVLRHELTHYRRGDLYVKLLELLGKGLHWYNPLIYLACREIDYACEASCDEQVMRGATLDDRQYYSETIIAVIRRQSARTSALSTSFYGGKRGMKNRILSIMNTRARRLGALLLCPVVLLAVVFTVVFASEPAKNNASPAVYSEAKQSIDTLIERDGDRMTNDAAWQKGLALFIQTRFSAQNELPEGVTAECVAVTFEDHLFGRTMIPTARVCMRVHFDESTVSLWYAYLTPVTGTPLLLTATSEDSLTAREFAAEYYVNPVLLDNQQQDALYATLPRSAYVSNPAAASANFCEMTTSYDWPQGTYLNGTPVTVTELRVMGNNIPYDISSARLIYWAKVSVGVTQTSTGVQDSWIPLSALTFADEMTGAPAALPIGTITTAAQTGQVSLYAACNVSQGIVTVLSAGTQVEVLGRTERFYHVRTGNTLCGFVPVECLSFDADTQALMDSIVPEHFDSIQPGQQESYEEYMTRIEALLDEYGDSNDWPLDIKAKATEIRMAYGFDTDLAVNILPGEGDMSMEQATAFADARVAQLYGMTEEKYAYRRYSFYYDPQTPEEHLWKIYYVARTGMYNCAVTFNQQGEVVRDFQSKYATAQVVEDLEAALQDLSYYIEYGQKVDFTPDSESEAALDTARQALARLLPAGEDADNYTIAQKLCRDICTDNDGKLSWWQFTCTRSDLNPSPEFVLILLRDGSQRIISIDPEDFQDMLDSYVFEQRLAQAEALYGAYATWTLEQKAAANEWTNYGDVLPAAQDISIEKALSLALNYAAEQTGIKSEQLAQYPCYYYFTKLDASQPLYGLVSNENKTVWHIAIQLGNQDGAAACVDVFMDSQSGEMLELWDSRFGNG